MHYHFDTKDVDVIDTHNPSCGDKKLKVQDDYGSQKLDLLNALQKNNHLTVCNAMDLLRETNNAATQENKRQPLEYEQVKRIIRDYRQDNNIHSQHTLSDPALQKTLDSAIFLRC